MTRAAKVAWLKWLAIAIGVLVIAGLIADWGWERHRKSVIFHNLRMLQSACLLYCDLHDGRMPGSVADLLADHHLSPDKVLVNPTTGTSEAHLYSVYDSLPRTTPRDLFAYYDAVGWYVVREDGTIHWHPD